jgi:PEP-CTERM motif
MIGKLTVSLALAVFAALLAPAARPDSISFHFDELLVIDPVIVGGKPDMHAIVQYTTESLDFVTPTYHIAIAWGALQQTSLLYFGTPDNPILPWDSSMSFVGCQWQQDCQGTVFFAGTGMSGTGSMWYSPHYAYMAIDTLTITTPEPGTLLLLSSGFLGPVALFRRKISALTDTD